jgi:outer membrane protein assembly factor BamB
VPASFEEAIEPSADGRDVAVVDHFGVVSLLDLESGALRWQHDLAHALLATRVSLTGRRVVFSSFSGDVFVLDRADGSLVARLGGEELGGYVVSTRLAPWGGPARLLVALRLGAWKVDLRRIP